jgi:hypothetical protein
VNTLRGRHAGQTAVIVGKGPSLLSLTSEDFPPGAVVITLNQAIVQVRTLGLPNACYLMEKDGCIRHDNRAVLPLGCIADGAMTDHGDMIAPLDDETLLLSVAESSVCYRDHPYRYLFDVEADFGLVWWTMSAPIAVRIAEVMGCTELVMLGHDAYTSGDVRRVEAGQLESGPQGYYRAGEEANAYALEVGLPIEWVAP